jgi:hypothetical protein
MKWLSLTNKWIYREKSKHYLYESALILWDIERRSISFSMRRINSGDNFNSIALK